MKKLHLLLVGMLTLSVSLFTSCGEDPVDQEAPSIKWANYDGKDLSVLTNEEVKFEFELVEGTGEIESVEVYYTNNGKDTYVYKSADSSKAPKSGDKILITESFPGAGVYPFTFIVADKDDLKFTDTVNVTVEAALVNQGSKTLGASGATTGSYYSIETGLVYTTADAKTNVAKINIVYNYDATDGAQVYSPKLSTALGSLGGVTETKFVKSTIAFATAKPADLNGVIPSETKIKNLKKDDVVVFETAAGKKGIFLVESVVASVDGTASLTIKVK